jgi:hypothetical protein
VHKGPLSARCSAWVPLGERLLFEAGRLIDRNGAQTIRGFLGAIPRLDSRDLLAFSAQTFARTRLCRKGKAGGGGPVMTKFETVFDAIGMPADERQPDVDWVDATTLLGTNGRQHKFRIEYLCYRAASPMCRVNDLSASDLSVPGRAFRRADAGRRSFGRTLCCRRQSDRRLHPQERGSARVHGVQRARAVVRQAPDHDRRGHHQRLCEGANVFDATKVAADAASYELSAEWTDVALQGPVMPAK